MENSKAKRSSFADKHTCLAVLVATLQPIKGTIMLDRTFCEDINLMRTNDNMEQRRVAVLVQGIVHTAPETPFLIKFEN